MSKTKKTHQPEVINQQEDLNIDNANIVELNDNQPEVTQMQGFDETVARSVSKYKILQNCIVCNFGYKVGDVLTKEELLKCIFNDGMILNFINTKDIVLC